jgi:hypothetical protein
MSEELKDASITLPKAMLYGNAVEVWILAFADSM